MGDRLFGGDGSRYQNWAGRPAHWWNISYDTHSRAQRAVRDVFRLLYVVMIVAFFVAFVFGVLKPH
jgi:hypothetical protein